MLSRLLLFAALISIASLEAKAEKSNADKLRSIQVLSKFALGSCNSQYREQPLWEWIIKDDPQLWIWGGDNVYADTEQAQSIEEAYNLQNQVPGYKKLKENTPIIGTWDDHDYGQDNAGWELPFKRASQSFLLDFLEEPEKSPRRLQDGVYTSYEFGAPGKMAKVIILDNRFFLNQPDSPDDVLGEEQWRWFEEQISNSDARVHFVVSGLSVFSYMIRRTEEWRDHPQAFERMKRLLRKHNPSGTVFLTGDKHFSSVFNRDGALEFMSSGLTHTVEGRMVRTYVSRFYPNSFFGLGYGLVEINWDKEPLEIALSVKTYQENPVFRFVYKLNPQNKWDLIQSLKFPILTNETKRFSF